MSLVIYKCHIIYEYRSCTVCILAQTAPHIRLKIENPILRLMFRVRSRLQITYVLWLVEVHIFLSW